VAAVLAGWRTRRTVTEIFCVELQFYFRVISQFFSRTSCVFEFRYLINGKWRITAHMTSSWIFYGKGCVCWTLFWSFCNGELYEIKDTQWAHLRPQRRMSPTGVIHPEGKVRLYEIKSRIIENDGRVSVCVMRMTKAIIYQYLSCSVFLQIQMSLTCDAISLIDLCNITYCSTVICREYSRLHTAACMTTVQVQRL